MEEEVEKEEKQRKEYQQSEISKEEIIRAVRKFKRKKAPGLDGIRNEAWKARLGALIEPLHECIKEVWKKGEMPKS